MSSVDETAAAAMPPPAIPHTRHRTSSSIAQSPRVDTFKRVSMEIATPGSAVSTRPNSMVTTFTEEPGEVSSPGSRHSLSFEPANPFLTAVAAQERRVLELREELQKAESELRRLKTQWAQQEATRKRQEAHTQTETLRPLTSPTRSTPVMDRFPHRASLSLEDERKKAMYAKPPRMPERRVFTGRHARTLSLLSPGSLANRGQGQDVVPEQALETPKTASSIEATMLKGAAPRGSGRPHADSRGTKEDLVNTGKQLVGDLREGLWSFWDDLRQATVGDEAALEPAIRRSSSSRSPAFPKGPSRNSSNSSLKAKGGRQASRSPHTRSATISVAPVTPARKTRQQANALGITTEDSQPEAGQEDGGWSNWDSPAAKTVISTAGTGTFSPGGSTPRTSVSSTSGSEKGQEKQKSRTPKTGVDSEQMGLQPTTPSGKDSIPWPSLQKLSPVNLQRTASHLMKEWERSLTPPAEESERDWIDRYIDGPRRRKGTSTTSSDKERTE